MNEFKGYHPIVNLIYFVLVIGFTCVFMHPISLCVSLSAAVFYLCMLKGRENVGNRLKYMIPTVVVMALINPAFNHRGETILAYFTSGNPLTLESVFYGIAASLMIAGVIFWFSCFNNIMTSDKIIYLFGRILPALSLVISMAFRFVPRFFQQLKVIVNAQRCLGRDISSGSIIKRIKNGLAVLSVMITKALEDAIETADSMKSRGYGTKGRTAFSIFTFDKRDAKVLTAIAALGIYIIAGFIAGKMEFVYFPSLKWAEMTPFTASLFVAYFILCIIPVIIGIWEVRKWKALKSRI